MDNKNRDQLLFVLDPKGNHSTLISTLAQQYKNQTHQTVHIVNGFEACERVNFIIPNDELFPYFIYPFINQLKTVDFFWEITNKFHPKNAATKAKEYSDDHLKKKYLAKQPLRYFPMDVVDIRDINDKSEPKIAKAILEEHKLSAESLLQQLDFTKYRNVEYLGILLQNEALEGTLLIVLIQSNRENVKYITDLQSISNLC